MVYAVDLLIGIAAGLLSSAIINAFKLFITRKKQPPSDKE